MEAVEFSQKYERDISSTLRRENIHRPNFRADLMSNIYGMTLHDALTGNEESLPLEPGEITNHLYWAGTLCGVLPEKFATSPDETTGKQTQQLAFHALTAAMAPMWRYLQLPVPEKGSAQHKQRTQELHTALACLAATGTVGYSVRQAMIDDGYQYYKREEVAQIRRGRLEGFLNEIDVAMVGIMYALSRPEIVVVPGPIQFERRAGKANADFIVFDKIRRNAVGLQVKSRLLKVKDEELDRQRVVPIDCDTDLEATRMVKQTENRTSLMRVTWGGVVAAHHFTHLKTVGHNALPVFGGNPSRNLLYMRFLAKRDLGKIKSPAVRGLKIIGDRLDASLGRSKASSAA